MSDNTTPYHTQGSARNCVPMHSPTAVASTTVLAAGGLCGRAEKTIPIMSGPSLQEKDRSIYRTAN